MQRGTFVGSMDFCHLDYLRALWSARRSRQKLAWFASLTGTRYKVGYQRLRSEIFDSSDNQLSIIYGRME